MKSMRPLRTENLPWREIDDRAIIVQPNAGKVHELNSVGTFLWSYANGKHSIGEILRLVSEAFESARPLPAASIQEDVLSFYNELELKGLISWHGDTQ